MNAERIAELKALCEKATPGPWWNESGVLHAKNPGVWTEENPSCIHPASCPESYWVNAKGDQQEQDAEFIAAARTALPECLAEVERLEEIVGRLYETRDGVRVALHDSVWVVKDGAIVECVIRDWSGGGPPWTFALVEEVRGEGETYDVEECFSTCEAAGRGERRRKMRVSDNRLGNLIRGASRWAKAGNSPTLVDLLAQDLLDARAEIDRLLAELVEQLECLMLSEGYLEPSGRRAGWYNTGCLSDVRIAGERLVELGKWERLDGSLGGEGRLQWYRPKKAAEAAGKEGGRQMKTLSDAHKAKMKAAKKSGAGKPRTGRVSPLRAIRAKCLDCCETREVVKFCTLDGINSTACPLWPFRFGKRPESVAKGPNAQFVDPKQMPPASIPQEECGKYAKMGADDGV